MTPIASRILDRNIELELPSGKSLTGRLEYFASSKSIAVFDEAGLAPSQLTVPFADAQEVSQSLEPDHVLLRNWTEHRGVAAALAGHRVIELTGEEVQVGQFRLQALVARVL